MTFIRERLILSRTLRSCMDPNNFAVIRADIRNLDHIIEDSIYIFE